MKKLILSLSLFTTIAQAEVLVCHNNSNQYLLALDGLSGQVFIQQDHELRAVPGHVEIFRGYDGGLRVTVNPNRNVTWENGDNCFRWIDSTLRFRIDTEGNADFVEWPNFVIKPNTICAVPQIEATPPQPIDCKKLSL